MSLGLFLLICSALGCGVTWMFSAAQPGDTPGNDYASRQAADDLEQVQRDADHFNRLR